MSAAPLTEVVVHNPSQPLTEVVVHNPSGSKVRPKPGSHVRPGGRRRHVGGGVYLDNGLPFGSANPQELAAGKMLRGAGRKTRRKVRIPIKKNGDLTNLGYSLSKKSRTRHGALKKAVKKFGRATVSRKLNALAIFNKRRHPATARKARADRKYAMKV
jgi:hypothetical protein